MLYQCLYRQHICGPAELPEHFPGRRMLGIPAHQTTPKNDPFPGRAYMFQAHTGLAVLLLWSFLPAFLLFNR
jgi:transposase